MARKSGSGKKLLAFGTIAAAGVLAGCEEPPPSGDFAFRSVAECQQAGFEQTVCETKLNEAIRVHAKSAPKFDSRAACEAEYGVGKCGGGAGTNQSFFSPFLTGFLISQTLNNLTNSTYRTGQGYAGGPIYRTRTGRSVSIPGNATPGTTARPRPLNANTRSAARSGFGGRSFSRSRGRGWGG